MYIEDSWTDPLVAESRIIYNNARDGGGGGIMWERTPPTLLQNVVMKFNSAQYGNNMASGIARLLSTLKNNVMLTTDESCQSRQGYCHQHDVSPFCANDSETSCWLDE